VAGSNTNGRLSGWSPNGRCRWETFFVFHRERGTTELVLATPDGTVGNSVSVVSGISADGRYMAYYNLASDLVPGDSNNTRDIFVHDRKLETTERVSVASNGIEGDLGSFLASLSDDGRYVTFYSETTNLVPGDDNNLTDVFVHDRKKDTTTLLSRAGDGTVGNDASLEPAISGSGKYVVCSSLASDLVPGDGNGFQDIFVASRFDWLVKVSGSRPSVRPGAPWSKITPTMPCRHPGRRRGLCGDRAEGRGRAPGRGAHRAEDRVPDRDQHRRPAWSRSANPAG
jgi:hypothetical protein